MSGSSGIAFKIAARIAHGTATGFLTLDARIALQNRVVDEPRGADASGDGEERAGSGGFDRLERRPIDESDVVDADCWLRAKMSARSCDEASELGARRLRQALRAWRIARLSVRPECARRG